MTTSLQFWLLLAGVLLAFILRRLVPSDAGITLYLTQHTRYISWNVIVFWTTLVLALLVAAIVLVFQNRNA